MVDSKYREWHGVLAVARNAAAAMRQRPFSQWCYIAVVFLLASFSVFFAFAASLDALHTVIVVAAAGIVVLLVIAGAVRGSRTLSASLAINACILLTVPALIGIMVRADDSPMPVADSVRDQDLIDAAEFCQKDGVQLDCRVSRHEKVYDKQTEYTVGVIELFERLQPGGHTYPAGIGVVALGNDRKLFWKSKFEIANGFQKLGRDTTGNVFVAFHVSNHSTKAWAFGIRDGRFDDYGTITESLKIDNFTDQTSGGVRYLYTYRVGWPESDEPGALQDRWEWDGSQNNYRYSGCALADGSLSHDPRTDGPCPAPVGEYSFNL